MNMKTSIKVYLKYRYNLSHNVPIIMAKPYIHLATPLIHC